MKKSKSKRRLVILGGPSCVGKSPLAKALKRFHPDLAKALKPIVLYNSRAPRPGEEDGEDYHFRSRDEIAKLREKDNFVVMDVRGDLQALDVDELKELSEEGSPFFEGNPYVARALQTDERLDDFERLSVFVSPLSQDEIRELRAEENIDLQRLVTDLMRRKRLRRTQKQKTILSLPDLEDIERRAGAALRELKDAHRFDHVIPNHDGEDSDNWSAFYYPLGDARLTVKAFAALLAGEEPPARVERWDASLLGGVESE